MDLKAHHWVALAIGALGVRGGGGRGGGERGWLTRL